MTEHIPVMPKSVLRWLKPEPEKIYVDATFGRGGHSKAILNTAKCRIFAIDRDKNALAAARKENIFGKRLEFIEGRFGTMDALLPAHIHGKISGIVFDLGVSSPQLADAGRGFSFQKNGPLDMRMGDSKCTAAEILHNYSQQELASLFRNYGQEPNSVRIAKAIVKQRQEKPLNGTRELAELISTHSRRNSRIRPYIHPATRCFQALRIAVNDEINELKNGLAAATKILKPAGRMVVISFHSLEDRIVKQYFRGAENPSRHALLAEPAHQELRVLTRKPVRPDRQECERNIRSRSARLRAAEKLPTERATAREVQQ